MVIFHLESSLNLGGQEARTLREIYAFLERGHKVILIAPLDSEIAEQAKRQNIPLRTLEMPNGAWPPSIFKLLSWIQKEGADILHSHSGKDALLAGITGRISRRRPAIVRTRHIVNPIKHKHAFSYRWLPHRLLVVSDQLRERFITRHKVSPEKILTLKPSVDFSRYNGLPGKNEIRRKLNIDENQFVVGMVARFRTEKGHATLVQAFQDVLRRIPNARLLLIGEDRTKASEKIKELTKDLAIEQHVSFLGFRNDVPRLLKSLDVFVLASHREPLPNVIMEAFASGCPVVATAVDGNIEVVNNGESGLLVPPRDPSAMANAIIRLYNHPEIAASYVQNAMTWVRENHEFERAMNCLEEIYRDVLKEIRA
jgi:glycosyltransferase involved in cell wall biosynthesis